MDVKGPNLIKSRQFDGLRQLGNPSERAKQYYNEGRDESIYLDVVASLYGRSNLMDIVEKTSQEIFLQSVALHQYKVQHPFLELFSQ